MQQLSTTCTIISKMFPVTCTPYTRNLSDLPQKLRRRRIKTIQVSQDDTTFQFVNLSYVLHFTLQFYPSIQFVLHFTRAPLTCRGVRQIDLKTVLLWRHALW